MKFYMQVKKVIKFIILLNARQYVFFFSSLFDCFGFSAIRCVSAAVGTETLGSPGPVHTIYSASMFQSN